MKFKKLVKKLTKIEADVPVRFYHPDLPGDFYLGPAGEFMFLEKGTTLSYTPYTLGLEDFQRTDWQIASR